MVFELQFLDWLQNAADADFKRNYESGHTSWRRGRSVDYTGGCSAGISEDEKKRGDRCGCAYCRSCVMQRDLEKYICPHAPV